MIKMIDYSEDHQQHRPMLNPIQKAEEDIYRKIHAP